MPATLSTHLDATVSPGERRSSFVWAIFSGLVAAALVLLISLAWITLMDVRNGQSYHNQTLARIDRVDHRLTSEIHKLNTATATVNQILKEAGNVSSTLLNDQHIICQTIHANC